MLLPVRGNHIFPPEGNIHTFPPFLASSARKTAKKKKLNVTIEARSASEANELLSTIDVLLIGPHYAKEINKFQELTNPHGVAVALIPEDIYGSLDGERLIAFAQTLKN